MNAARLRKTLIGSLLLILLTAFGAGCRNTAEGVGQDVENAGEEIQDVVR
jgi:predicted small secreted protein